MESRSPPPSKRGRREDDDNESRYRKKLEKGKEPAAKDADEEPLFDDNKFTAELLRSAFRKLQGVGEAFDIKAHHDVYKDPTLKGLAFRIPWVGEEAREPPRGQVGCPLPLLLRRRQLRRRRRQPRQRRRR
jgi:hypothetical protein